MPTTDLHLVVDIAAWWITAVYESGSVLQPVLFDGRASLPSGVFDDAGIWTAGRDALADGLRRPESYRPDPMTLLRHGGPVEAVAAVLAHVAAAATGRVAALTVVTAHEWEQPARHRLERAAALARLPRPRAISTAAAAAALAGTDLAVVCVPGTAWPELTLVDTRNGYRHLATAAVRAPGVPAVDEALLRVAANRAGTDADPDNWQVCREVEQARAVLAVQPRASMLLPEPHGAVELNRDDLAAATAVHLERLPDSAKQLLADAGTDPAQVGAVVMVGEDPQLGKALAGAALTPTVTVRDTHALLRSAAATRPPGRPSWRPWQRRRF
ncbi:hypothetical protein [Actinoplanes derwentensis]|uniref:Uncharacterized protein n=1 Tax=Actinoplanes derwentensis TaxID=113562 RepID=A0A1H1Z8W6_9ACTN|nr:hypothetical protein [Actinoplanes derwentensis]SDT29952.1 hypothetical protein SAMN04489716_3194 [Actinoplanes derwentensis]